MYRNEATCPLTIPNKGKSVISMNGIMPNGSISPTDIRPLSESPRRYIRWLMKRKAKKLCG